LSSFSRPNFVGKAEVEGADCVPSEFKNGDIAITKRGFLRLLIENTADTGTSLGSLPQFL
jgi:hypothetical protein